MRAVSPRAVPRASSLDEGDLPDTLETLQLQVNRLLAENAELQKKNSAVMHGFLYKYRPRYLGRYVRLLHGLAHITVVCALPATGPYGTLSFIETGN